VQNDEPFLDQEAVRSMFGPSSEWACQAGASIKARRLALGFTLQRLADLAGTTVQTIQRVETGKLIPREYLKASIAVALVLDVTDIWAWPPRHEICRQAAS
jgi:transcriptional regulator with XRE-family HTH domain